jgi:transposase
VLAPLTIAEAGHSEVFEQSGEHCLVPALRPGDIVLLDNGRFHYRERVISLIQAVQARLEYLPAYSPDLEPAACPWHTRAYASPRC